MHQVDERTDRQIQMNGQSDLQRHVDDRQEQWMREGDSGLSGKRSGKQFFWETWTLCTVSCKCVCLKYLTMRLHASANATEWLHVSRLVACRLLPFSFQLAVSAPNPRSLVQIPKQQLAAWFLSTNYTQPRDLCCVHTVLAVMEMEQKCNFSGWDG